MSILKRPTTLVYAMVEMNLQILCCLHRTVVSTTPDLHRKLWGLSFSTAVFDIALMCQIFFLTSQQRLTHSIPRIKTPRPLMACRARRTAKSNQTNCNRPNTVFTTCSLHVPHVFPHVYHVFTTCLSCVYHVFTTCSPRVHHVFTTCSPRVYHVP